MESQECYDKFQKKSYIYFISYFHFLLFIYLFIYYFQPKNIFLAEKAPLRNSIPHFKFIPSNFLKSNPHFFQNFHNPSTHQKIGGNNGIFTNSGIPTPTDIDVCKHFHVQHGTKTIPRFVCWWRNHFVATSKFGLHIFRWHSANRKCLFLNPQRGRSGMRSKKFIDINTDHSYH